MITINEYMCLNDINPGQRALVGELKASGGMRRRLMDLGLTAGTPVECVGRSPGGDPRAYLIRGAVIALRGEDCRGILVRPL